jgi:ferric-dicitrate binding protein FerR (iron transport regulator)
MAELRRPHDGGGPGETGAAGELWSALADAQDAALARKAGDEARAHALENALAARVLASGGTAGRRRTAWLVALGSLGAAGGAAAVVMLLLPALRAPGLSFQLGHERAAGAPGRTLVAEAESELPLRFSDGSSVTFQPGSAGRVERLTGRGAEVVLERGRLAAAVQHAADTRWLVRAGPFRVRVTGTRFEVDWQPPARAGEHGRLAVSLREGSVIVDGGLLGDGVPLRAGQRLRVGPGGGGRGGDVRVRTDSLELAAASDQPAAAAASDEPAAAAAADERAAAAASDEPGAAASDEPAAALARVRTASARAAPRAPAASPRPAPAGVSASGQVEGPPVKARVPVATAPDVQEWRALAERGDYAEALRAAERVGLPALARRLGVRDLLALGDVARYAGAPAQARRVFELLVRRYPGDPATADAVFSLGRLAFEAERPAEAARWFARYLDGWPAGPLAAQAAARLDEAQGLLGVRGGGGGDRGGVESLPRPER